MEEGEAEVRDLLQGSLWKAYGLAAGSVDIRRSGHQDRAIIVVVLGMIGWAILLALTATGLNDGDAFLWCLGLGTLALFALTVAGIVLLKRSLERTVAKDIIWSERLLSAIRQGAVAEGMEDRSTVLLLLDACQEIPRWLRVQRKGVWYRKPYKTLLIFFLLSSGATGVLSYNSGVWGGTVGISGILLLAGMLLFIDEHLKQRAECREMQRDWEQRMSGLESVFYPGDRG